MEPEVPIQELDELDDFIPEDQTLPEAALLDILDLLKVPAEEIEEVRQTLAFIADNYWCDWAEAGNLANTKAYIKSVRAFIRDLERALNRFSDLPFEYQMAIRGFADNPEMKARSKTNSIDDAQRLRAGARKFLDDFSPVMGPPVNVTLEAAVRSLRRLAEQLGASAPTITQNKSVGTSPELKNASARAIGRFVQSLDASINERTICNMILRTGRLECMSMSQSAALLEAHPNLELSMTLLRDRD